MSNEPTNATSDLGVTISGTPKSGQRVEVGQVDALHKISVP